MLKNCLHYMDCGSVSIINLTSFLHNSPVFLCTSTLFPFFKIILCFNSILHCEIFNTKVKF